MQSLVSDFPWGVLLITDLESTEEIPSWDSPEEPVAVAKTALAVRVQHADQGHVLVRVITGEAEAGSPRIFDGKIIVPSGVIRVSNALGRAAMNITVVAGSHRIRVYSDSRLAGALIDVQID